MRGGGRRAGAPALIISLDFEQHWGLYDLFSLPEYRSRLDGGRRAVPLMLDAFQAANVHATWATVGLLMCEGRSSAKLLMKRAAEYPRLSASLSRVLDEAGESESEDPYHFCRSLVERIVATPDQELATHTFSHFYCLEEGPNIAAFENDLIAARLAAEGWGKPLTSIVFPRNQYSAEHLQACKRQGITAFRGNPQIEPYLPNHVAAMSSRARAHRLLDAYAPVVSSDDLLCRPFEEEGLVNVPASRFLRPLGWADRGLKWLRIRRVLGEMSRAAELGAAYHLWWHPHNFGHNTEEHLALLQVILSHFQVLRRRFGMQSLTMAEAAQSHY